MLNKNCNPKNCDRNFEYEDFINKNEIKILFGFQQILNFKMV